MKKYWLSIIILIIGIISITSGVYLYFESDKSVQKKENNVYNTKENQEIIEKSLSFLSVPRGTVELSSIKEKLFSNDKTTLNDFTSTEKLFLVFTKIYDNNKKYESFLKKTNDGVGFLIPEEKIKELYFSYYNEINTYERYSSSEIIFIEEEKSYFLLLSDEEDLGKYKYIVSSKKETKDQIIFNIKPYYIEITEEIVDLESNEIIAYHSKEFESKENQLPHYEIGLTKSNDNFIFSYIKKI